jgi:rhodanese-related sulfurtransferase
MDNDMYAKNIGKDRVEQLLENGALLVDMRSPVEFRNGSVDGAINLPLRNFLNKITGLDKKTKIIVFGAASDDSDVTTGINYAAQLGFNTLYVSEFNKLQ